MRLEDLRPAEGAVKNSKRVGRGPGSGTGGTSARGNKGQLSRSGASMRAGFEGGQMPLQRRMPKRGFTNIFRVEHAVVNLRDVVARFPAGSVVTPAELQTSGLIKSSRRSVKILGEGDPKGAYTLKAHAFSESARAKVEKAGGTCEVIEEMIEQVGNLFRIPDLRKRLIFTLLMIAIYRVGSFIPVPGVDPQALRAYMGEITGGAQATALDFVDMLTGGALSQMAIFAMGIMPYISASIILQLLTVVWPTLERLSKEGEVGRRKITRYTRYLTGVLAAVQASGMAWFLTSAQAVTSTGQPLVPNAGPLFYFLCVLTLTTGTVFIMWLGEQISERGIGNGISLLIFASICNRLVPAVKQTWQYVEDGRLTAMSVVVLLVLMVLIIAFIVFVERAQRRIPVQYAKRVVGRQVRAGASTHLPLKLNTSGVIPVIFAQSVIVLPGMLFQLPVFHDIGWVQRLNAQLVYAMPLYSFLYILSITFFCFFYTSIVFNPVDTTDNIKKYGGFIPGIRPGKKTAEYIDTVLTRLTFWGALYLSLVCLLPMFLTSGIRLHELPRFLGGGLFQQMPNWFKVGLDLPNSATSFFGGTSLLIVVGVAMDFVQQLESQLIMRHYDGFLRGTRIRGRRG